MTKRLSFFFAFYLFVCQPLLAGRLRDDSCFYQLAGFNAWICIIARVISAICCNYSKCTKSVFPAEKTENLPIEEIQATEPEIKEEIVPESVKEEKNEKSDSKSLKETVSIPKIVQPLAGHSKSKKKKDIKYGQWLVLLFTLVLATLITRILREFFGVRSIAIALLLWWIFYLIIWKLADIEWFYKAKYLFSNRFYVLLILAWIGYGVYTIQQSDQGFNSAFWIDLKDRAVTYVKDRFKWDKAENPQVETGVVYVFEWTGEVLDSPYIAVNSWDENNAEIKNSESSEVVEPTDVEESSPTISEEDAKKQVTMWDAIKSLLAEATLSTKTTSTFKYVPKNSELYPYFKTAQEKWMIGTDTDPNKIVSCETYITMKGLYEWRNVWNYVKSEIRTTYWNKAVELWKLNGCEKWEYLTKWNL